MKSQPCDHEAIAALIRERLGHPGNTDWGEARMAFLTHLSHELRTPVTALKLALEGLCDDLQGELTPGQSKQAEICVRSVNRIIAVLEERLQQLDASIPDDDVACRPAWFLPLD